MLRPRNPGAPGSCRRRCNPVSRRRLTRLGLSIRRTFKRDHARVGANLDAASVPRQLDSRELTARIRGESDRRRSRRCASPADGTAATEARPKSPYAVARINSLDVGAAVTPSNDPLSGFSEASSLSLGLAIRRPHVAYVNPLGSDRSDVGNVQGGRGSGPSWWPI